MGNQIVRPSDIQSVDNYYSDLKSYMQFKSSLGSTTFVKTAKVVLIDSTMDKNYSESRNQQQDYLKQQYQQLRELQQLVVVKIFPKYDLSVKLDCYSSRVRQIQSIINTRYKNTTNCFPFFEVLITDQAAYLFRQYIKYNLYDRLSTRPFLTNIEKKWIAFQLLCAVNDIHSLQIVHGDIKIENVMINSFLWTSLTDFGSYKPVYLSKNHPTADFNYFFDISRRRTCYLAPERLDQPKDCKPRINTDLDTGLTEIAPPDPNDFKPEMDIFSLGCVIAELFTERPLFSFAQLLAYKDNKNDPRPELESEISDINVLEMICSMISLKAEERKTASQYLQEQNDKSFPSYFVFLRNCISYFIDVRLTGDDFVIKLKNDLPLLLKNFKLNLNESDRAESVVDESPSSCQESTNDAFLILLSVLLSSIRKIKFAENKLIAVDLMQTFGNFLQDSIKLERIIPYYLHLLTDVSPIVKFHVTFALNDCLSSINKLDVRNFNIFAVLIFDHLERLSRDESFLVRCAVAKTISSFALTSIRYLDLSFIARNSFFNSNLNQDQQKSEENKTYDKEYEKCQSRVKDIVLALLTDNGQNSQVSNAVREILISSNITKLCLFFQRQKTSDVLLAHMITVLNEKTDWSVRAAFFDALCPVLSNLGWESIDIFKSLIEQGLRDSEEFVIYRTLLSLSKMAEIGLLDKQQIYYFLKNHVAPLLCHPSLWIRHGCVNFITTVCRNAKNCTLNTADILGSVAAILAKFLLRTDLIAFDRADVLFESLKPCVKREILLCISQSGNADTLFHYFYQRRDARNYLPRYFEPDCQNAKDLFGKLCKLGFLEEDDEKILELKDFIEKTKRSQLSSSVNNTEQNFSSSRQEQSFRDKIIKFNSENLAHTDSKAAEFSSSSSNFNSSLPPPDQDAAYNAEWRLMFGMEDSKPLRHKSSFKNSSHSDIVSPTAQSRRRAISFNFFNAANCAKKQFNCNYELEKYVDRTKRLLYDQMSRRKKCQEFRDTVNKSVCSNLISLNKVVGKWKPKGALILNSNEHTKCVNKIVRSGDAEFFATCSSAEQCVKVWSVGNVLESRTGLYRSLLTLDNKLDAKFRPISSAFYAKSSLAILNEDFKLYFVDFNRSQSVECKILSNEKLLRSTACKSSSPNTKYTTINSYYLNKACQNIGPKCSANACYCAANFPIELINIDETSPSWPVAALDANEYFHGTKNSPVKGLLCYSTSSGGFSCVDMRCKAKAFDIKRDLKRGFITSMMTDPWFTWIAMGTSTGNIEVFDFRFMLPVVNFEHRSKASVVKMCNSPVSARKIVASYQANNELCVWNMDGKVEPELVFWGVQSVPPLCQNKMSNSYISGLVGVSSGDESGTNGLLCSSTDMKLRYLDLVEPHRNSSIVSSAFNFQSKGCAENSARTNLASSVLAPNVVYETRQIEGNKVLLELDQQYSNNSNSSPTSYSSAAFTYQSRFTHHQDAITDLSVCYNPLRNKNQPLVITAARDGTLKIWR